MQPSICLAGCSCGFSIYSITRPAPPVAVGFSIAVAAVSGVLAFFISRRSRFAVVAMLIVVIALQLFTWFVAYSLAGTIVSIVVVALLLRGARRMFQEHAEREMEVQ